MDGGLPLGASAATLAEDAANGDLSIAVSGVGPLAVSRAIENMASQGGNMLTGMSPTRLVAGDVASITSSNSASASMYNAFYLGNADESRSGDALTRPINPVHALQGLLRHLARVVTSEARRNMEEAYSMQQSLRQLQQHAKNLRAVHPRICVADNEQRVGLSSLPKASRELARWLKQHPHGYGQNQTPYVFDFELRVLAFFPPCEFDTALQPPNDTSAKFRKILSTVFNLMPCDDEALLDLTETATLSQHASAGYAITTSLFYIDKLSDASTDYMHSHHLGDEREGTYGTVSGGYVRFSAEDDRYVFTEESGHYGSRWTLPGTRQSLRKFMQESNLQDSYFLKPFFRQNAKQNSSISQLFAAPTAEMGEGGHPDVISRTDSQTSFGVGPTVELPASKIPSALAPAVTATASAATAAATTAVPTGTSAVASSALKSPAPVQATPVDADHNTRQVHAPAAAGTPPIPSTETAAAAAVGIAKVSEDKADESGSDWDFSDDDS